MRKRFNETKATQAAAKLLHLRGGSMNYMKLIKLLYIADREALARWSRPITTDRYVSMDKGPVLSQILGLIRDEPAPGDTSAWRQHISAPENYAIQIIADPGVDELSPAEEHLLEEIFLKHGQKSRWTLVDEVHDFPEWQDPQGSAIPITVADILRAQGKSPSEIAAVVDELENISLAEYLLQPV